MDLNAVYNTLSNNPEITGQREGRAEFLTYEPNEAGGEGVFVLNDMNGGMQPFEPSIDDQLSDDWVCHA
ncbi:hypothetical protein CJP72_12350 [Citrobacter sp. NCU1]|uniref:hypothetical protein n=1 Tax=Citrobacter sp. NCU1 TaxID=2026683 RepID=UPI00139175B4|nr:hypothetical protein [Citrobacter sp. NCU1]NDO81527.1 hypothetical protein [Citrobacter sp. NCU1]